MTEIQTPGPRPEISVVFLLYNAEHSVTSLLDALLTQRHPQFSVQAAWLEAIFLDDSSQDNTFAKAQAELERRGSSSHIRLIKNEKNLGISMSLNRGMLESRAPLVLTCHSDCFFVDNDYIFQMLQLFQKYPQAAAITGQPTIQLEQLKSFPEKLNLIINLMDVLPELDSSEVTPVGFAESRCDGFRKEALYKIGMFDERLMFGGEDQIACARLRTAGYQVFKARRLRYRLSVSEDQNTVSKLVFHERVYGKVLPYILFNNIRLERGLSRATASPNRRWRALLRLSQPVSIILVLVSIASSWARGTPYPALLSSFVFFVVLKLAFFRNHLRLIPLTALETTTLFALQPLLDAAYTLGLVEGTLRLPFFTKDSNPVDSALKRKQPC